MMKVLSTLVLIVAVLIAGVFLFAATRPSAYHVERSATMTAPPSTVFATINDLHQWENWSPWAHLDPTMKVTYSGPPSGVNASYAWVGNDKVGAGNMTITESTPDSHIGMRLEFLKPMAGVCQVTFHVEPDGSGSKVTWAMDGTNNFVGKVFSIFMNMDQMIGKDFTTGLTNLKSKTESMPAPTGADSSATAKQVKAG